jgi:hypothetical protein
MTLAEIIVSGLVERLDRGSFNHAHALSTDTAKLPPKLLVGQAISLRQPPARQDPSFALSQEGQILRSLDAVPYRSLVGQLLP